MMTIEEEIVNQKEANNISFVETEKIIEEKSPQVVHFQEEPKICEFDETVIKVRGLAL